MKLIEYLPNFLQNLIEFKELFDTEDIEVEKLLLSINNLAKEAIVKTAEDYGLRRYEKIYNITNISNSIEARRTSILFRMNFKVPYSFFWLNNLFNESIGEGNYNINLDYNNYKLTIEVLELYKNIAKELQETLRKEIPANLELEINIFQTEEMHNKYICGVVHQGEIKNIKQEV